MCQTGHVPGGAAREGHMKHPCQSESRCHVPAGTVQVSHPHWEEAAFHASTQGDQRADQPSQPLPITEQLVPPCPGRCTVRKAQPPPGSATDEVDHVPTTSSTNTV